MNKTLRNILNGQAENHILPFFWQHGENAQTLIKYMHIINEANCGAVCVESRPHPDFCGEKWWQDMDVILHEAQKLKMKVWILDDSHFPTGYANGALKKYDDSYCRQNLFVKSYALPNEEQALNINLQELGLLTKPEQKLTGFAAFMNKGQAREFNDESVLSLVAQGENGQNINLTNFLHSNTLVWQKPQGNYTLKVCVKSRNTGCHTDYINMTEEKSCKILIDEVYEAHWQHYKEYFGNTIAGFFSDEPELGNNMLYIKGNRLGTLQDLPWGATLEKQVIEVLGKNWQQEIFFLWDNNETQQSAKVRYIYMDLLTKRVRQAFSYQIRDWCKAHGVQYIGHMIEDEGQHARTGSGLGHYFRGLQGQDMAGVDDIGGQVLPQGENEPLTNQFGAPRTGEFYHYALAKLAASAAAIEPKKNGNAMCEIFGNYGWAEGLALEKYLADHFLVRGVNKFVPHAFSPAPFPDPDCPPHFYAHGHHPQIRHFGQLMGYMNRVATLTSSGKHNVPVAVLYHAEAEWSDIVPPMQVETPLRVLQQNQIDCHIIPADVFVETDLYNTKMQSPLLVNGQEYKAIIVPQSTSLCSSAANALAKLAQLGANIIFVNEYPKFIAETGEEIQDILKTCKSVMLDNLPQAVNEICTQVPKITPENKYIRVLHIKSETDVYMLVNEDKTCYRGSVNLPTKGECYGYDGWKNQCYKLELTQNEKGQEINIEIQPLESVFIVFGKCPDDIEKKFKPTKEKTLLSKWDRSMCEGINYPEFKQSKQVCLPDNVALENENFSGIIRYETQIDIESICPLYLVIDENIEGVEVFCNNESLGIQIYAPYTYNLTHALKQGKNTLAIEVATTLERQCYPLLQGFQKQITPKPTAPCGITGTVTLYKN